MILVTGATGFVGQALCEELDRRQIAYLPTSRAPRKGFHMSGEIDGTTDWASGLIGVTTVVHLAARVHVMNDVATDPLAAFRAVNVDATLNLARQAAAAGARRFVFLSSIKVNGESTNPGKPFTSHDIPQPGDPYGLSKWEAERALVQLGTQTGMEIVIIRPPLVYGPGVKANFASMMAWVRRGVPLPLGRVANKRSLVFVKNLADLILVCAESDGAANRIFLVSDGRDLSIAELLRKLAEGMGRPVRIFPISPRLLEAVARAAGKGAAARRLLGSLQVDISDTRSATGWTPPYSVDEGLRQTVRAFLKDNPRA
ncbi:UDP-glucose 4-epimerase family protein [Rhizobium tubonense]|uniref:UDP-glucose 4-epimerase n=1 Tax=Rhizobium tubonense TaxID=484088 RepID=A0A2W4EKT3_9HYPH|nr:SDR family oxidoreductase [Rhizobium tubonense]PZM11520.1 UDP-glucose 4-epimerase [Rhizobium tubonense]